jgi:RNA polymerase sigma-70 factor (sigma-E family)
VTGREEREARDAAYDEFVRTRREHLRRVAYAACGDWHRADDVVQTALVKLYVAWPRVRRDGGEEAYARRTVVRTAIDESRRPWRRERATGTLPERTARDPLPVEERDALLTAVLALPPMQRATVLLRHWLDLSVAETAADLGLSEGTVKSHTSRGLAALGLALREPRPAPHVPTR